MARSPYREDKLLHAKRMIRRGDMSDKKIRAALMAVFGSAISPSEFAGLKREIRGEPKPAQVGPPIILYPDGTWKVFEIVGKDPAT